MIEFSCKCGRRFSYPESQAGDSLQCPDCLRLVDVPLLGDLENYDEDGLIKLAPEQAPQGLEPPAHLDVNYIPRPKLGVEDIDEYDLRPTVEEVIRAGTEEIPLAPDDEDRPELPKYDPETGELIRPMKLKPTEDPAEIPVAKAAIAYATPDMGQIAAWQAPMHLFTPANVTVLIVIAVIHAIAGAFAALAMVGFFLAWPIAGLVMFVVVAHYANTVDEVGPAERDDLPVPLRQVSWSEDIWHPFVSFAGAGVVCYLPAGWAMNVHPLLGLGLAALGTLFFPAVLLTTTTSGTFLNLRPDRVLKVMWICGGKYFLVVLLWVAAVVAYFVGTGESLMHITGVLTGRPRNLWLPAAPLGYTLLIGGIYLMHLFAWYLGLLYRAHHEAFPWVLQRYIPMPKEDLMKLRRHRMEQLKKGKPPVARAPRVQNLQAPVAAQPVRPAPATAPLPPAPPPEEEPMERIRLEP